MNFNGEGEQIFGIMAGLGWMNIESIVSNWKSLLESAYDIISSKSDVIKMGTTEKAGFLLLKMVVAHFWQ